MNKQQLSCTKKSLLSSMTEERLQRQGTMYGRDFLSTSDGDDYQLELDNDYKKFILEEEISPTRSVQFLLPKLLPKHNSPKHKSPQLRLHPNKVTVSCRKKQDTKHRVNGFMQHLSLQMRRRRPNNEDILLDLLQVKKPSPETQTVERSPYSFVHLVRGPTLHPYRTVSTLHPYHIVPSGVLHEHEAVSLHFSFSLIDDDDYFLDTIDDNDPSDNYSEVEVPFKSF